MADKKPGYIERFVHWAFGGIIERAVTAAVSVRVDDSPGWTSLGAGPNDTPWGEKFVDLGDALTAWKKNFLVRRIVTITHAYVIGNGITVTSKDPEVDVFVQDFWKHPKNKMADRLIPMCDELTRSGEVFPVLFTNHVDGNSYVRFVPACLIPHIETDPNDLETELAYRQTTISAEPKIWMGIGDKKAFKPVRKKLKPLMLHYAVNRPVGATRGESDLTPILPWAKRYSEWLKDRVRFNRRRTRQGVLVVTLKDRSKVESKRTQLQTSNPLETGIYVKGDGETVEMLNLNIDASDVKDDGKSLRLAVSSGAILGPHHLGEGESINFATAKEMNEPTARFHTNRQKAVSGFLVDLVGTAYLRKVALGQANLPPGGDLQLSASVTEVTRADNESLANAARRIVQALNVMKERGWIDDQTAIRWAFKFAGEAITEQEITRILASEKPEKETDE